jgi:DnaK suppressor protein
MGPIPVSNDTGPAAVKTRLLARLAELQGQGEDSEEDRQTVTLDQQSVGRLSRMDAMQRQAMAQATERRRGDEKRRIEATLARIEDGEYGYCTECGEDIAPGRLAADPTVPLCLSCARG